MDAFAVFSPTGKILSTRTTRTEAESAAKIIGGTEWEIDGYTVEPVQVTKVAAHKTRIRSSKQLPTHKDMVEDA